MFFHPALRFIRIGLWAACTLSLLMLAMWFKLGQYQLLSVQSNSMQPAFKKGDALLVKPVSLENLVAGTIVSYRSPVNERLVVSHRVISVDYKHHQLATKGDSLKGADPLVPFDNVQGVAVALVPSFGRVIDFSHTLPGLVSLVYLPALLLVLVELKRLLSANSARSYRRYGYR